VGAHQDQGVRAERQLVVFTLHSEQFAVPIETVREIVRYTRPMAGAAAGGLICGMISLRGAVVPVADLSERLGHEPHTGEGAQIVVLELREGALGLIVDHVEGVQRVSSAQISPTPVPGAEKGFGDEIAAIDDELVLLLDPQRVLGSLLGRPATRTPRPKKPAAPRTPRAKKPAVARAKTKPPARSEPTPPASSPATPPAKPPVKRRSPTRRPPSSA
jgi:chemotaxis signal transduction protein